MKKVYIIFFIICVGFFATLYFSVWCFVVALCLGVTYLVYSFYQTKLQAVEDLNEAFEDQIDKLQMQLDTSLMKEQRTVRKAEQVKEAKQQLLHIISHEIRTPMNGIMGMTTLLEETSLTAQQKEYTDTIRLCGENLVKTVNNILVNDVLDISKFENEDERPESRKFDLRNCVEEVLDMFAGKANAAGIDLMYDMDMQVPEQVVGDSKRVRQVLMNLVENAVKFTSKGEIIVEVSLKHDAANMAALKFEVRDTGVGIDERRLNRLFEGVSDKTTQNENNGLGLLVCKRLVDIMGGKISATSTVGSGSCFMFSIPLVAAAKTLRSDADIARETVLQHKTVLVVEPNAHYRNILTKKLISWKMSVKAVASEQQAIEFLVGQPVDLVLGDMNEGKVNGARLVKPARPVRHNVLKALVIDAFSASVKPQEKKLSAEFSKQYPLRILVAEDNVINQKLILKILGSLGYQPELACDGKEVMEIVGVDRFDLILMDVQMPEMNGLEATRMIRTCIEIQPVIIALTANVMLGDQDECMQAGMDDYISKPIDLNELMGRLEKWYGAINSKKGAA